MKKCTRNRQDGMRREDRNPDSPTLHKYFLIWRCQNACAVCFFRSVGFPAVLFLCTGYPYNGGDYLDVHGLMGEELTGWLCLHGVASFLSIAYFTFAFFVRPAIVKSVL